jgi:hypothetical protein
MLTITIVRDKQTLGVYETEVSAGKNSRTQEIRSDAVRSLKICRACATALVALSKLKGAEIGQTHSTHARSVKCLQNNVFHFGDKGVEVEEQVVVVVVVVVPVVAVVLLVVVV